MDKHGPGGHPPAGERDGFLADVKTIGRRSSALRSSTLYIITHMADAGEKADMEYVRKKVAAMKVLVDDIAAAYASLEKR